MIEDKDNATGQASASFESGVQAANVEPCSQAKGGSNCSANGNNASPQLLDINELEDDSKESYVIYADVNKCKGCRKCELACIASHNEMTIKEAVKHRNTLASRVHVINSGATKLPVQCRQCENAPCTRVCPTHALIQTNSGKVVMRTQFCAGCGLCMMACPYGAITRSFIHLSDDEKERLERSEPRAVAVRCDLCHEWRRKENKFASACVEACPAKALALVTVEEYRKLRKGGATPLTTDHSLHDQDAP